MTSVTELAAGVRARGRPALAAAITLVESTRPADRSAAEELVELLYADTGRARRIGISGAPGVGKSTFVEALGMALIADGQRVAVLAVDPSSAQTGGSILGDKTRMERLGREQAAFIRPSPSGQTLGGVARRTREAMLVCEAAGYDTIFVETVGVGQSETAVADMVDMFVLLLSPAAGDDLQGIKRGIVEIADLIVVNKADGALLDVAERAAADYRNALTFMRSMRRDWTPQVMLASALEGAGVGDVGTVIDEFYAVVESDGSLDAARRDQLSRWLWSEIRESVAKDVETDSVEDSRVAGLADDVRAGRVLPPAAARTILGAYRKR